MSDKKKYAKIAVNFPLRSTLLDYSYDDIKLKTGDLVKVPLGKRSEMGVIWQLNIDPLESLIPKIKSVGERLDTALSLGREQMDLFEWMAGYYHYGLGKVVFDFLPKQLKRPREVDNLPSSEIEKLPSPTPKQLEIIEQIRAKDLVEEKKSYVHGVTGSGKTVVYMHLMKDVIDQGRSVLFLLPEINLTPQFIDTLKKHFSVPVFEYHSAISNSSKFLLWKRLKKIVSPVIVLGVRSSVLLPIANLGLIVVDEEHDSSFKQEDRCKYNAREVALKRAQMLDIPIILGSATPSMEMYHLFHVRGMGSYYEIEERVGESVLPEIRLINADDSSDDDRSSWPLCSKSLDVVREHLELGEQVVVFVNRLGYSSYIQCRSCSHRFFCPNCSIPLKFFKSRNDLECRHCDYKIAVPESCPECSCMTMSYKGFGTEKVHEVISKAFPKVGIERFDRDKVKTFNELKAVLDRFHSGETQMLVGTQMLSKGHNFKNVNLVLVLGVDTLFNYPDFRSEERIFQLVTQISGRAGRFSKDGVVAIQTLNSENHIFEHVRNGKLHSFYDNELPFREAASYPPFARLIQINIVSRFQDRVEKSALDVKRVLSMLCEEHYNKVVILGPRPNFIEKRVNKFSWHVLVKSSDIKQIHSLIETFQNSYKVKPSVQLFVDVDPYMLA